MLVLTPFPFYASTTGGSCVSSGQIHLLVKDYGGVYAGRCGWITLFQQECTAGFLFLVKQSAQYLSA